MNAPIKQLVQQQTDAFMQTWFGDKHNTHCHVCHSHSTNSQLIEDICRKKLSPDQVHLLTADQQSAGRGQHGRDWQSPMGNLYLSLYCPTPLYTQALNSQALHNWTSNSTSPQLSGMLSLCIGYALTTMPFIQNLNALLVANHCPKVGVKWANDLGFYLPASVDSSSIPVQSPKRPIPFYKLAGTLIEPVWLEGKLLGLVVGVGMNVNVAPTISTTSTTDPNLNHSICLAQLLKQVVANPNPIKVSDLYLPVCQAIFQGLLIQQMIGLSQTGTINTNIASTLVTHKTATKKVNNEPTLVIQEFMQTFAQINLLHQRSVKVCSLPKHKNQSLANNENQPTISTNYPMYSLKSVDATSSLTLIKHAKKHPIKTSLTNNQATQNTIVGNVVGIDVNGCLLVKQENGKVSQIFTGQITLLSD